MASEREAAETLAVEDPRAGLGAGTAVVALVLVAASAAGGAVSALVNYDLIGLGHLPRIALFCVFLLLLVNAVWTKLLGRRPFSTVQLAFVYIAILVMAGFPGQQLVTYLYFTMIGAQYYAAGAGNDFSKEVIPHLKPWLVPSMDPEGPEISWAFHGLPDGGAVPWASWVRPLLMWTPLLIAVLMIQTGVAALLRKRWEEERLTYPLAQAPLDFMRYESPRAAFPKVFGSWLFWIGFVIPTLVYTKNALSFYYPDIRKINTTPNLGVLFGAPPWSNLDYFPVQFYFEMIGATYLIPTATAFSLWFFWIARRLQYVARDQMGLLNHAQYTERQGIGAYHLLAALYIWGARKTIVPAFRRAFGLGPRPGEEPREGEPLAPSWAVWVLIVGVAIVVGWTYAAGAPPVATLAVLGVWLVGLIVLSRLVAESGLFCVWTPMLAPHGVVVPAWPGKEPLGPQAVTGLCVLGSKIGDTASATMANILQGFHLGDLAKLRQPGVMGLMAAALIVGLFVSHPPALSAMYSHGVYDLGWWCKEAPRSFPDNVHNLSTALTRYTWADAWTPILWGAAVTGALHACRMLWHQFPLQALAYAACLGPSWMMDRYGFSIFLGWALKSSLLRFGSVGLYNRLRPFSVGLIAGNSCVLLFWTIYHWFRPIDGVLVIE